MTEITSFDQFIPLAIRTESKFDRVVFDKAAFTNILTAAIAAGNLLDLVKKTVAYNKPINPDTWNAYVDALDSASNSLNNTDVNNLQKDEIGLNPRLFHGVVGIATEAAELLEAMNLAVQSDGEWDSVNIVEELGDIFWYKSLILNEINLPVNHILTKVINKLEVRYPDKYSNQAAINRDTATERVVLEA